MYVCSRGRGHGSQERTPGHDPAILTRPVDKGRVPQRMTEALFFWNLGGGKVKRKMLSSRRKELGKALFGEGDVRQLTAMQRYTVETKIVRELNMFWDFLRMRMCKMKMVNVMPTDMEVFFESGETREIFVRKWPLCTARLCNPRNRVMKTRSACDECLDTLMAGAEPVKLAELEDVMGTHRGGIWLVAWNCMTNSEVMTLATASKAMWYQVKKEIQVELIVMTKKAIEIDDIVEVGQKLMASVE